MSQPSSNNDDMFVDAGPQEGMEGSGYGESGMPSAPQYRKQGFSIYTMLLILSFLSLTASAIMLFLNVRS